MVRGSFREGPELVKSSSRTALARRRLACVRRTVRALVTVACAAGIGCPDDPLAEPHRLEREGEFAQAAQAYLNAARADPANLAAWDGAVRVACEVRLDVAACLEVLDLELEVLGSVQRHADALAYSLERRARARLEQGLVEAAAADLKRAEAAAPERGVIHATWARLHLAQGDVEAARRALDEARKRSPDLPELKALYQLLESAAPSDPEGFGGKATGAP
jgi:tetratricopeptide (TPR) repeat protein